MIFYLLHLVLQCFWKYFISSLNCTFLVSILACKLWHNSLTCRHKRIIYSLVRPIMDVTDVDNIYFFCKSLEPSLKKKYSIVNKMEASFFEQNLQNGGGHFKLSKISVTSFVKHCGVFLWYIAEQNLLGYPQIFSFECFNI